MTNTPGQPRLWTRTASLALCVTGFATSALLLWRATTGTSSCGLSGGCDLVAASSWSQVLGIPLPAWGLAYFAFAAFALRRFGGARWLRVLTLVGSLGGVFFIGLQALVIGAWCPWCVCVDLAAVGLGVMTLLRPAQTEPIAAVGWRRGLVSVGIAATGLLPPLAVEVALRSGQPNEVDTTLEVAPAPDGLARIIEFVDIECPFCRTQYLHLAELVAEVGHKRVELELRHVPLAQHKHAREAARVACCSTEQGCGTAVMDALMRTDDLSAPACRSLAVAAGANALRLDECLDSDRPDLQLEADRKAAEAAGVRALPTCLIGTKRFEGLQSKDDLRMALRAALSS